MSGTSSPQVYPLLNLLAPAGGTTRGVKITVTLAGSDVSINWTGLFQTTGVWLPQSMTVDNTASATDVTVQEQQWGWTRIIPGGVLQTFNFPAVQTPQFVFSAPGNAAPIVSFFDFPSFPDATINATNYSGAHVIIDGQPISVSLTGQLPQAHTVVAQAGNASAIVTGGVQVAAISVASVSGGGFITNPNGAPGSLFVNLTGGTCGTVAGGSVVELVPGQTLIIPPGLNNAVTANALAPQTFVCVIW